MQLSKESILHFLLEHKMELLSKYAVKKIGLFGSYARNEATDKSDIDIIVDMPSDFDMYYDLKEYLENAFNTDVDLGFEKKIRSSLKSSILKDLVYV